MTSPAWTTFTRTQSEQQPAIRPTLLFTPSQPTTQAYGSPIAQQPQGQPPPTPGSYYISPQGGSKARTTNLSSNLPDVLPPPPTRSLMDPNISSTPAPLDVTGLPYPTTAASPGLDVSGADRGGAVFSQPADYLLSDRGQDQHWKAPQANGASVSGARDQTVSSHDDTWVTVFGFTPEDSALVLRELQDCGRIVNYGAFAPGRVNWLHVEFGSRHEAQRALLKNGMQLGPSLIIGVRAVDPAQRAVVSAAAADNPPIVPAAPPAPMQYQRLAASATSDLQALTLQQGPRKSTLGKIIHYVVGL